MSEKLNPLSDFYKGKDGVRLSDHDAMIAKMGKFCLDVYGVDAIDENGNLVKLGEKGAKSDMVDFISGAWRIQREFPYEITRVRDRDMVLMKKTSYNERTFFEFWDAKLVGYNCYGPFISDGKEADFIVSRYETDNGVLMGYGKTKQDANAFLGVKIYDEYKDIINAVACKNKLKSKQK